MFGLDEINYISKPINEWTDDTARFAIWLAEKTSPIMKEKEHEENGIRRLGARDHSDKGRAGKLA